MLRQKVFYEALSGNCADIFTSPFQIVQKEQSEMGGRVERPNSQLQLYIQISLSNNRFLRCRQRLREGGLVIGWCRDTTTVSHINGVFSSR